MSKTKNVTFNLPPELIEKYKSYVRHQYIPSVNAGVREALEQYSNQMDKELLKNEMLKAAKDPIFMTDLYEVMKDFDDIDSEVMKENTEW